MMNTLSVLVRERWDHARTRISPQYHQVPNLPEPADSFQRLDSVLRVIPYGTEETENQPPAALL